MKIALVTGGSRGIGRAIVQEFVRANMQVAFTYAERADAAEDLADPLRLQAGERLPIAPMSETSSGQRK